MFKSASILKKVTQLYSKLKVAITSQAEGSEKQMLAFAIFGILNYPTFYIIWLTFSSHTYESFTLRAIATVLCLFLLLKNSWPEKLKKYTPIYWYITLCICLPFFGTFMFLANHGSNAWVMNGMLVLFLLILVVDWASFAVLLTLGVGFGVVLYALLSGPIYFVTSDPVGVFGSYLLAVVIGAIFSRNRENTQLKRKVKAIELVGANIAHELRTPLRAINNGVSGIKKHFPTLLSAYQYAIKHDEATPKIRFDHFEALLTVLDDIQHDIDNSNIFIDMLLVKINPNIRAKELTVCSINSCIDEAIRHYPFTSNSQIELIHWDMRNDFNFLGSNVLIMHVLFNLFKNALFFIKDAGKGQIFIATEIGQDSNKLYFKDTSKGIPNYILPQLFTRFFTQRLNGTGLGLAFCKMVMTGIGGDIICNSRESEYTEFVLIFPKVA